MRENHDSLPSRFEEFTTFDLLYYLARLQTVLEAKSVNPDIINDVTAFIQTLQRIIDHSILDESLLSHLRQLQEKIVLEGVLKQEELVPGSIVILERKTLPTIVTDIKFHQWTAMNQPIECFPEQVRHEIEKLRIILETFQKILDIITDAIDKAKSIPNEYLTEPIDKILTSLYAWLSIILGIGEEELKSQIQNFSKKEKICGGLMSGSIVEDTIQFGDKTIDRSLDPIHRLIKLQFFIMDIRFEYEKHLLKITNQDKSRIFTVYPGQPPPSELHNPNFI